MPQMKLPKEMKLVQKMMNMTGKQQVVDLLNRKEPLKMKLCPTKCLTIKLSNISISMQMEIPVTILKKWEIKAMLIYLPEMMVNQKIFSKEMMKLLLVMEAREIMEIMINIW